MRTDTAARADTAAAVRADSVPARDPREGIVLVDTRRDLPVGERHGSETGVSWVITVLALLFCVAGVRYKSNRRFLNTLLRDLVEVRERHNLFDDTMRETSFLILLSMLTAGSAGVLLYVGGSVFGGLPGRDPVWQLFSCVIAVFGYFIIMPLLYRIAGYVFGSHTMSTEWLRGSAAGTALLSFPLLIAALAGVCYPAASVYVVYAGAGFFLLAKLLFIYKGFRIFITQSSSWVLFLYYLCNLEIVPLIVTYIAASQLCMIMH